MHTSMSMYMSHSSCFNFYATNNQKLLSNLLGEFLFIKVSIPISPRVRHL